MSSVQWKNWKISIGKIKYCYRYNLCVLKHIDYSTISKKNFSSIKIRKICFDLQDLDFWLYTQSKLAFRNTLLSTKKKKNYFFTVAAYSISVNTGSLTLSNFVCLNLFNILQRQIWRLGKLTTVLFITSKHVWITISRKSYKQ